MYGNFFPTHFWFWLHLPTVFYAVTLIHWYSEWAHIPYVTTSKERQYDGDAIVADLLYQWIKRYLVARRATYVVDGRFFGHFFWKVEGSSAHTRESRATHVCHVQLTCGKLLYGGGEPLRVAHVCHVWQLTYTLLLYGGGEPSRVANVCHVWKLTCTLLLYGKGGPWLVAHMCHVWLTCVMCGNWHAHYYYMVEGSPHMCHVWQLTCTLLLYGGGEPSRVAHVHSN